MSWIQGDAGPDPGKGHPGWRLAAWTMWDPRPVGCEERLWLLDRERPFSKSYSIRDETPTSRKAWLRVRIKQDQKIVRGTGMHLKPSI